MPTSPTPTLRNDVDAVVPATPQMTVAPSSTTTRMDCAAPPAANGGLYRVELRRKKRAYGDCATHLHCQCLENVVNDVISIMFDPQTKQIARPNSVQVSRQHFSGRAIERTASFNFVGQLRHFAFGTLCFCSGALYRFSEQALD